MWSQSPILQRATSRPAPGKGPRRPEEAGGIKKGFLGGGGGGGGGGGAFTKRAAATERPDLTVVRKAEGADPLMLPDVQKSMDEQAANSSAAKVGGGGAPEWVTPALLQQIATDPLLRKAFTDPKRCSMLKTVAESFGQCALQLGTPALDQGRAASILGQIGQLANVPAGRPNLPCFPYRCGAAMAALQQDPKKAMETYADVPEMRPYTVQPHAAPCNPLPPRTHLCRP